MEKWMVAAKRADFEKWAHEFQIDPVLARIIRNRDIVEEEQVKKYLFGSLEDCYSPSLLLGMEEAVAGILNAINSGLFIRVIGDYDVDGICSSYIMTKGLALLGAKVDTAIPHRIHDGYGLNDHLIEEAVNDKVGMIVTCDNGIAAASQIQRAGEMGISVIVTDHHEVPFEIVDGERKEILPPALSVVDPKQKKDSYPFKNICGGVVAFKVIQALYEKTREEKLKDTLEEFLEFAALSTVCDVMELKDENRIFVKEGLKRLRKSKNPGLRALMEVNQLEPDKINAYHLGFVIGPCLNATGRLDTAKRALGLLQSRTKAEAMTMARELKDLNDSRKNLTLEGEEAAKNFIVEHHMEKDKVLIVYLPNVHESLAGIVAGRIREKYNRPTFILTKAEEGVKGSGRSIETYHMFDAMVAVKEYFTKFGGHKLAAGLSMREEDIDDLRTALNDNCTLTEEDFIPVVHIDVPMPISYAGESLARQLEILEPFGVGNPKPVFAQKNLTFLAGFKMGKKQNCARYRVRTEDGFEGQVVYFGDLEQFGIFLDNRYGVGSEEKLYAGRGDFRISVAYQLGLNTFKGETKAQFIMLSYC